MNHDFLTHAMVVEVAGVKPFAQQILDAFDSAPDEMALCMEADTPISKRELIDRQMWLLRLLLYGSYIMLTSYDVKYDKGLYAVKVYCSRVPDSSRDEHRKVIESTKEKSEAILQG